jgi:hypothetical protein
MVKVENASTGGLIAAWWAPPTYKSLVGVASRSAHKQLIGGKRLLSLVLTFEITVTYFRSSGQEPVACCDFCQEDMKIAAG